MKTFKYYIREVLEKRGRPYPYKWVKRDKAEFTTDDGRTISTLFIIFPQDIAPGLAATQAVITFHDDESGRDATGKGDAFRIFTTVGSIILEFLKKNKKVDIVSFSGSGGSRVKLYKRLVGKIPGFSELKIKEKHVKSGDVPVHSFAEFQLVRDSASKLVKKWYREQT